MTGNTGLLTARCDPFGAESRIQLLGGMYDEKNRGKYMWHCDQRAAGRYRMICQGGDYGHQLSPGQGLVAAYHCDGGHKGQVMPLCTTHAREFTVGPPKPGYTRDLRTPVGQIGGTKANEMCPACMWPPEARTLQEQADDLQQRMSVLIVMGLDLTGDFVRLQVAQDRVRGRMDELFASGRVHKCPLQLIEVS
jgi:hypothetical protein